VDKKMAGTLPPQDAWLTFKLWDKRGRVFFPPTKWQWLWQFGGELLVMETVFHEGPQYALSPIEFIPVVQFLQTMHENGYVHGDIRCANIVFGRCLIDFDLGGRVEDAPRYPDGYESNLPDGARLGRARKHITKWHDWSALLTVIFVLHELAPPETMEEMVTDLTRRRTRFATLARNVSLDDSEIQNLADELIKFLNDAESWVVPYSGPFRSVLDDWGVFEEEQAPRETSNPATGSPPEKR
jgi:hypothetical protein